MRNCDIQNNSYEVSHEIGNYYGSLLISRYKDKFYWGIENYDGTDWEEITKSLFEELVKFKADK